MGPKSTSKLSTFYKEPTMPIKEIMMFSIGVLIAIFFTNPLYFREATRKTEFQILREVTKTDNWGNPDIFKTQGPSKRFPSK
jgi:hypothetical protein